MIFLFRKEIKKWNTIWWLVLASLVFGVGGTSLFLWNKPTKENMKVASVDGNKITFREFKNVYGEMKATLDDLAMYWRIPAEQLAKIMGMTNIVQSTLDKCVQNKLVDKIAEDFSISIDHKSFQDALSKSISKAFIDETGALNAKAYQNYLSRLKMSVADFEKEKEQDFKRRIIFKALENSGHIPSYIIENLKEKNLFEKKFNVMILPFDKFLAEAKEKTGNKASPSMNDELKEFFEKRRDGYKVNAKAKVRYWVVDPEDYKEKIEVDEKLIEKFYNRNKSSLYRIPPKVKVRTIIVAVSENASPDLVSSAQNKIRDIQKKVSENPEKFAEIAKKHSEDKATAKNGGLVDFFQRGTHDPEFERTSFIKLKKAGDISDIVKTKRGFEIIKLEDRISASQKPLEAVKDDIIKTLIDRKSVTVLHGDMESVVRSAKTDPNIFEKFSESNKLQSNETGWLTIDDARGYDIHNKIAERLFSARDTKRPKYGYFVREGKHVLYNTIEHQESFIPKFENVIEKVKADWFVKEASKAQKEEMKKLKRALVSNTFSISEAGKTNGYKVVSTAFAKYTDKDAVFKNIEKLEGAVDIPEKAFELIDPVQILEEKHGDDYFLINLAESRKIKKTDEKHSATEDLEREKSRLNQQYLDGFVASLQRNVKIEVNQEVLKESAWY